MEGPKETITITFGECGENHVGMQKLGKRAETGFTIHELVELQSVVEGAGFKTELHHLNRLLPADGKHDNAEPACLLVIRNGIAVFGLDADAMFVKLKALDWDKKMWNKGRVTNKIARYNLCFGEFRQEPDYEKKMGRVVHFDDIPEFQVIRQCVSDAFGEKASHFIAEGNYYYDHKKCYIGFHGDTERKMVIAFRFGASMSLSYQWYYQTEAIGEKLSLVVNHGDMYVMSEKAVGWDWHTKKKATLRHAAGPGM